VRLVVPHTDAVKGVAVDQGYFDRVRALAEFVELAGRADRAPEPGKPASQNQDSPGVHQVSSRTGGLLADERSDLGSILLRGVVTLKGHRHDPVAVEGPAANVGRVALGGDADKCPLTQVGYRFALGARDFLAHLEGLL